MLELSQLPKPRRTVAPATEPISLAEAKKQVEISRSDTTHDTHMALLMEQARQQWEHDTQEYFITQTWELKLPAFDEFQFPHRPVTAIDSITYYDTGNSSQTLATSVYELDQARNAVRLKYLQDFPSTAGRWDAVTVTYTLGSHADSTTVPAVAKQAMLLLIGYYFENRDMHANEVIYNRRAYDQLVARYIRSSYP